MTQFFGEKLRLIFRTGMFKRLLVSSTNFLVASLSRNSACADEHEQVMNFR